MIPELCLDRSVYLVHVSTEDHLIKFRHHLARSKFSQRSALLAGRALRVLTRDLGKVGSVLNLLFKRFTKFFFGYEDVSSAGEGHDSQVLRVFEKLRLIAKATPFNVRRVMLGVTQG